MIRLIYFISFVFISGNLVAQSTIEDDFINLLKDSINTDFQKSSLSLGAGAGNGVFSKKNNSLNANQEVLNKIFYNITADYYNKSGLGLTLNSSFVPENGSMNFYQASLTPSYYYSRKYIYAGVSYTHFFTSKNSTVAVNPFINEISGSFKWLKSLIRPGVQLVYSNGKNKEVFDTSYTSTIPSPPHIVHVINNIISKINDFTLSFSGDHKFNFEGLFSKNDEFTFIPALTLNAAVTKSSTTNFTNISSQRKKRTASTKRSLTGSNQQSFAIESIALSTDFYYSLGKFFVEPLVYADYYLPATHAKRLATIFSLTAGINF